MSEPKRRSKAVRLGIVPLLAAAFLAGCGDDDDEETAYCVNAENEVVDNEFCDDDVRGGVFFWYVGGVALDRNRIRRGTRLTGGESIRSTDRAAVARRGLLGSSGRSSGIGRSAVSSSGGSRSSGG